MRSEAAAFAAAIGAGDTAAPRQWATAFGIPEAAFAGEAARGKDWLRGPTRGLARLNDAGDPSVPQDYARALVDLAAAVGAFPDPTIDRINAAGFAASAQLRAVAPTGDGPPAAALLATRRPTLEAPAPEPGSSGRAQPVAAATAATGAESAHTDPPPPPPTLAELLAQLDRLVGLSAVKEKIHQQAELLRIRQLRAAKGLKTPEVSRHLVFVGNPGTGKTTVARLVGGIYRALDLLPHGQLIETDRSGLVAGYVGQTALKTADVIKSATGGVLFVDEAYALASDDFGAEAIDTLVKAMEDHRDDLVLIVAGYPEKMAEFIAANPGLSSRFPTTVTFGDYTDDELVTIFTGLCESSDFSPTAGCIDALRGLVRSTTRDDEFGNARFVRNVFEAAVVRQAWRLRTTPTPSIDELRALEEVDLAAPTDEG